MAAPGCRLAVSSRKEPTVATEDKAKNTAQTTKGKIKEAAGDITGNDGSRPRAKPTKPRVISSRLAKR